MLKDTIDCVIDMTYLTFVHSKNYKARVTYNQPNDIELVLYDARNNRNTFISIIRSH